MKGKKKFKPNPDLKLMDQVREVLRYHHYAYRTDRTQGEWADGCEVALIPTFGFFIPFETMITNASSRG
jgi:hypothetical protein